MLSKKTERKLRKIVGRDNLITGDVGLRVYQYDASLDMAMPDAVVFPRDALEVSKIVHLAAQEGKPYLPRGSGTNLSGGSIPARGGIIIELSRMNRILKVDLKNHRVLVEPGVYNLELQEKLAGEGFFYPPDPASQRVSTLGGNIGENSGGPHCLKYGVTTNHVLGLEAVLPSGQIIELGGEALQQPGYDLVGLLVGSEGTLAVVTKAWLRILPLQDATRSLLTVFDSIDEAAQAVTSIIKAGILPAAMEMMDRPIINAVEDSVQAGYPRDAESVLIIDVDGPPEEINAQAEAIEDLCRRHNAREVRIAVEQEERDALWSGRRGAFGAVARITPNYLVTDCTVPRTELPSVLGKIAEVSRKIELPIGNVFHAGDGNLHPLILFDDRNADERERAHAAGREIMEICAAVGGTISGEHGIGLEKKEAMSLIFSEEEMEAMRMVKETFDPAGSLNPDKIFPKTNNDKPSAAQLAQPTRTLEKELLDLLGAERIHIPEETSEEFRVGSIVPRVIAYPETEEEISEIVRMAAACDAAVVPRGSGSKALRLGIPERADVILSLEGLNGIEMIDSDNFVTTFQAGISYTCLQDTLEKQGLRLPLLPFYASRATMGGTAATADSGFPNPHLNSLRDLVLGMTVITADGRRAHFGGITMKNVAGYDMSKLFLGSYGTLGIITEMTMRLAPAPEEEAALVVIYDNLHEALASCGEFFRVCDVDSTIELHNYCSAKRLFTDAGLIDTIEKYPQQWAIILHCSGRSSWIDAKLKRYKALLEWKEAGVSLVVKGADARALRIERSDFFDERLKGESVSSSRNIKPSGGRIGRFKKVEMGENSLALQVSTDPGKVEGAIRAALILADAHHLQTRIACAPGSGLVGAVFASENGEQSKEKALKLAMDATVQYRKLGCNYHVERAPLNLLGLIETWYTTSCGLAVMKRLKQTIDPHNLLNPGKLISMKDTQSTINNS